MIEFLNRLDTDIFLAINGPHSTFFDTFMVLFTGRFIWIPMYVTVAWVLFYYRRWPAALTYLAMLALAILLTDQTCATLIRPVVERLRPSNISSVISHLTYIVGDYRGGNYGFPSCHAANSFALAVFISLFVRRWRFSVIILAWALVNSYSRIYLGVHYPGDLIVGGLIGSGFGALCYLAATLIQRRITDPCHTPLQQKATAGGRWLCGVNPLLITMAVTLCYVVMASAFSCL